MDKFGTEREREEEGEEEEERGMGKEVSCKLFDNPLFSMCFSGVFSYICTVYALLYISTLLSPFPPSAFSLSPRPSLPLLSLPISDAS